MTKKNWATTGRSYLQEIPVEQVSSKFSKGLAVSLIKGRYQLYTDKVIYSYEDLYRNFKVTSSKLDWKNFKPENILVLGLGLGSVIQIIEKKNKQPIYFTAVDIDESMMYLTQKYTASKFKSPIEYITADAQSFILQDTRQYDLIIFDIFIDDVVPPELETLSFLRKIKQRMATNGLLLMNRISLEPDQIMHNIDYIEKVFKKVFPQSTFIDVRPNWVLVSDKGSLKI